MTRRRIAVAGPVIRFLFGRRCERSAAGLENYSLCLLFGSVLLLLLLIERFDLIRVLFVEGMNLFSKFETSDMWNLRSIIVFGTEL